MLPRAACDGERERELIVIERAHCSLTVCPIGGEEEQVCNYPRAETYCRCVFFLLA